jgi:hypothetical protein
MAGFKQKGSLTVEAVFVVPVCLMVCFLLLQVLLYMHHICWYRAAAWECVLTELEMGDTETAEEHWQTLKEQQPLPVGKLGKTIRSSDNSCSMEITGVLGALPQPLQLKFTVSAKRTEVDPVTFLRQVKTVKAVGKG